MVLLRTVSISKCPFSVRRLADSLRTLIEVPIPLGYSVTAELVFFDDVYHHQRVGSAESQFVFDKSSGKSYVAHNERYNRPFQRTNLGLASQLPYVLT